MIYRIILAASLTAAAIPLAAPHAAADEYADSVASFALANPGCLIPGGDCDVTDDDGDNGLDALGAPEHNDTDVSTFTTLGYDRATGQGGELVLNFDDNLCLNGPGDDLSVFEAGAPEKYRVRAGLKGAPLSGVATPEGDWSGNLNYSFNQVSLTARNNPFPNRRRAGADIDAVMCHHILDVADIRKEHTGETLIDIGVDHRQHGFGFRIVIANDVGFDGALAGLTFFDAVPAEFDLDPDAELAAAVGAGPGCDDGLCDGIDRSGAGVCTVAHSNPAGAVKKGLMKLEPELLHMTADLLADGDSCSIEVFVMTDAKLFPNGASPEFAPTSCARDPGVIVLNEGVTVLNENMTVVMQDDDKLTLDCASFTD